GGSRSGPQAGAIGRAWRGEGRSLLGTILVLHHWSHFSHRGPGDGGDGFLALATPFSRIDSNVRARNPDRKRHNGTYADGPQVRRETGVMGPLEATAAQMSHMTRSLVAPLPVRNLTATTSCRISHLSLALAARPVRFPVDHRLIN